ncbi:MAG: M16 family metallopeptidase [Pyrinomonadaceae bacterium]
MTNRFKYIIFAVMCAIFLLATAIFSQTTLPAPKQEKLLNGLKVLMWSDAKADKVSVKIRIHSGSAFDPQGKEGLMQMLADNLFPNEAARDFFREDLGGDLEIVTNYDYVQVNASSSPENFLTMLESVATAVSNPTIDKETTAKLRTALLAKVATLEADPSYVADQAVAKRLFGTFPYGRPQFGTAESLKRIEFGDLIDAKNRFLTADNTTIAISGNFDRAPAFRAVRRYLGGWLKADKKVPATFRQPDEPDQGLQKLGSSSPLTEMRFAFRGVPRNDKNLATTVILARLLWDRLEKIPAPHRTTVANESHLLSGIVSIRFSTKPTAILANTARVEAALADTITEAEFNSAKDTSNSLWSKKDLISLWLDADTFKIIPANDVKIFETVTLADVTAYAASVRKGPIVSVLVSDLTTSTTDK